MVRRLTTTIVAATLLLGGLAIPAHGAETKMPSQLRAVARVTGHRYADHRHYVSGKLRLNNTSDRRMEARLPGHDHLETPERPDRETASRPLPPTGRGTHHP
jgi:hypothetical protein